MALWVDMKRQDNYTRVLVFQTQFFIWCRMTSSVTLTILGCDRTAYGQLPFSQLEVLLCRLTISSMASLPALIIGMGGLLTFC